MVDKKRKGVSPVIATVLLITMVVVLALIMFLWFKGLNRETITKFDGQNVEIVCGEVSFSSDYSTGILSISNTGNVPIYSFELKIEESAGHTQEDISKFSDAWPKTGLRQGGIYISEDLSPELSGASRVVLIPVLVGISDSGERKYVCRETNGQEISL